MDNLPHRYQIERLLGEGASATIYLARDEELKRKISVKVLKKSHSNDFQRACRFVNEFSYLKKFSHQNIIKVYDYVDFEGLQFYSMEYLEGESLDKIIYSNEHQLSLQLKFEILLQTANALNEIHSSSLLHLDLKPANILLTNDGLVKLFDFGIAAQEADFSTNKETERIGTPYYMSPEQFAKESIDKRSDIYSFGILAFELFAEQRPYVSESHFDLTLRHLAAEIPSVKSIKDETPDWIDQLVNNCLQKNREDRYQSIAEIIKVFALNLGRADLVVDDKRSDQAEKMEDMSIRRRNYSLQRLKAKPSLFSKLTGMIILVSLFLSAHFSTLGQFAEVVTLRLLFAARGEMSPPDNVIIISADELLAGFNQRDLGSLEAGIDKILSVEPKLLYLNLPLEEEAKAENFLKKKNLKQIFNGNVVLGERLCSDHDQPRKSKVAELNNITQGSPHCHYLLQTEAFSELIGSLAEVGIIRGENVYKRGFVNFYGPPGTIAAINFQDVNSQQRLLKDKFVILGSTKVESNAMRSIFDLPPEIARYSQRYSDTEVQATILANVIDQKHIRRINYKTENLLLTIIASVVFLILLSSSPSRSVQYLSAIIFIWGGMSWYFFVQHFLYIPGLLTMLPVLVPATSCVWFFYANAREKELIRAEEMTRLKFRS